MDKQTPHKAYGYYQHQLAQLGDRNRNEHIPFRWHTLLDHAEVGTDGTITYVFSDRQRFILQAG